MADHYAVLTNAVLDLLRPKWMKGTALPKVAAILLFVLGISAAGCSQADLTEPGDSPVPMMTPSETVQPSLAISISKPTPTPPETAQPLAPRTLWRISGPENLMASTPSANLHIHDVVLSPKHITVVYSIDLLNDDSDGSEGELHRILTIHPVPPTDGQGRQYSPHAACPGTKSQERTPHVDIQHNDKPWGNPPRRRACP